MGVAVGFVIGIFICYQILYTDITDHLPQLATMKALGYHSRDLVRLVLTQAMLLGVIGFIPALVMTFGLYSILTAITGIVTKLTLATRRCSSSSSRSACASSRVCSRSAKRSPPIPRNFSDARAKRQRSRPCACAALNHSFGVAENRKRVLHDNNLDLMPGEIIIMTGPSGSGKTTLLTLIGALRSVQEGSVRALGRELARLSARELVEVRRGIGFIFQAHNLFDSLTARENVNMAIELTFRRSRASATGARRKS